MLQDLKKEKKRQRNEETKKRQNSPMTLFHDDPCIQADGQQTDRQQTDRQQTADSRQQTLSQSRQLGRYLLEVLISPFILCHLFLVAG